MSSGKKPKAICTTASSGATARPSPSMTAMGRCGTWNRPLGGLATFLFASRPTRRKERPGGRAAGYHAAAEENLLTKRLHGPKFASILLVNVISKRGLFERAARYPDARSALQVWFDTVNAAEWTSLEEVRKSFPATDMLGDLAIFNIRGNNYRLIVRIAWRSKRIYVKEFPTHAEYDKGRWKKWLV